MKISLRWVWFGLLALGIIVLLVALGANKKLRQRLTALLLEKKVKTEIANLKDKAIAAQAQAHVNKISAEEAEQVALATDEAISNKKAALEKSLEKKGLSADEIANRMSSLSM